MTIVYCDRYACVHNTTDICTSKEIDIAKMNLYDEGASCITEE